MSNGDGSILEVFKPNGKSYTPKHWRISISYQVDDLDEFGEPKLTPKGKRKKKRLRVQQRCIGSKADAKALRDKMFAERDANGRLLSEIAAEQAEENELANITLSEMIVLWDNARRVAGRASERTCNDGLRYLSYVEKHLGGVPVKKITPQKVEATYASIRTERGLCGTSMNHIHTLLKNVLNKAVDYDIIYKNPCTRVIAPRRSEPNRKALSQEEAVRLYAEIESSERELYAELESKEQRMEHIGKNVGRCKIRGIHHVSGIIAVRLALATGIRRGEALGLTWEHIDFERHTLNVAQSLTSKDIIKVPKTKAGIRTIALDNATLKHLALWQEHQAAELAKMGLKQSQATPVCCSDVGGWFNVDNFEQWWRPWREAHGFADLKYHELRHTQATQLLANGVDVKTVQARMGHANASITLGWYAHAIPANDHAAAEMLGNLFAGIEPTETGDPKIQKFGLHLVSTPASPRYTKTGQPLFQVC